MMDTGTRCSAHENGFEHLHLPGSPHHFGEKMGSLNPDETALLHYISCHARDGAQTITGSFYYALHREKWLQGVTEPTPADHEVLRDLALAEVQGDAEAQLRGQAMPWFKSGLTGGEYVPPKYLVP